MTYVWIIWTLKNENDDDYTINSVWTDEQKANAHYVTVKNQFNGSFICQHEANTGRVKSSVTLFKLEEDTVDLSKKI